MLINLRNALMTGKRLPYDAEVEFLESTGTQCIDTGFDYFADFEITCRTYLDINCRMLATAARSCLYKRSASDTFWTFGVATRKYYTSSVPIDEWHTMKWKDGEIYVDGVFIRTYTKDEASAGHLMVLGVGNNTYAGRVSALKLWDTEGNLIHDSYSVRKGTVGYLYDRVSGKLFGNAGTGDFVLGPDVVPVEWLANGVAGSYINTGVASSKTISSKVDGIIFNPSVRGGGNLQFLYGKGTSWNYDSYALFFQTESVQTDVGRVSFHGHHNYLSPVLDSETHLSLLISANGTNTATITGDIGGNPVSKSASISGVSGYFSMLWARTLNQPNTIGLKQVEMYDGSEMIRSFLPIRVGTDATSWEGAMMDVLTRRIYRNQGSGAFGYGNDLKYPIPSE